MIDRKRLFALDFYKLAPCFTGSDKNKNYKIERVQDKEADTTEFKATLWPGPMNFANTADELKISKSAEFSEEGLQELVDWMNSVDIQ